MRLAVAVLVTASLTVPTVPTVPTVSTAASRPGVTCRSGRTLFARGAVRAFVVARPLSDEIYVCRAARSRPRLLNFADTETTSRAYGFRVTGGRLGFVIHTEGASNGSDTRVGWIDLLRGGVRTAEINTGENARPGDANIPDDAVSYAIAPDGAVAVIGGTVFQEVALLTVGRTALHRPRVLYDALHGGLDPRSITITATSVSWRTSTGVRTSVPR